MPIDTTKDQTYLEGIKKGDPKVVRSIYENFFQAIVKLVENNQGTLEDARDVFQEGLTLMYQKVHVSGFQLTSSFFTYFYAICRNTWSNKARKKSGRQVTLDERMLLIQEEDLLSTIERNEQYFLYRKKFLQLGEDCQKVLNLFLQKVGMEEIMTQMGYGSISYAKKRKFLCKEQLVKMIRLDPKYCELAL